MKATSSVILVSKHIDTALGLIITEVELARVVSFRAVGSVTKRTVPLVVEQRAWFLAHNLEF